MAGCGLALSLAAEQMLGHLCAHQSIRLAHAALACKRALLLLHDLERCVLRIQVTRKHSEHTSDQCAKWHATVRQRAEQTGNHMGIKSQQVKEAQHTSRY